MPELLRGIDCTHINAAQARAAVRMGFSFVGRYLVPPSGDLLWKALTRAEAMEISQAGLGLLCIWETSANRALSGSYGGKQDGCTARELAAAIGMPPGRGIIYFAVDFDATPQELEKIAAYMQAAQIEAYPYDIGVYGGIRTVDFMVQRNIGSAYWQCCAWSGKDVHPKATIYQYDWEQGKEAKAVGAELRISVDLNICENLGKAGIWRYPEDEEKEEVMDVKGLLDLISPQVAAEIVHRAQLHAGGEPLPETWEAEKELQEAIDRGITDGKYPMAMATRLEAAVMVKRAMVNAAWASETGQSSAACEDCDVEKILSGMEDDGK